MHTIQSKLNNLISKYKTKKTLVTLPLVGIAKITKTRLSWISI